MPPTLVASAVKLLTDLKEDGIQGLIVAFSGGKDSRVVLDLAVEVFGRDSITCYTLYSWPGLQCEIDQYSLAEKRYGIKPILLPHPMTADAIRSGEFRSSRPSTQAKVRRKWRWTDVEKVVRYRTGLYWIAAGHRTADSLQRCGMIKKHRGRWEDKGRLYPLWQWQAADILSYLRGRKIPIPFNFDSGIVNTSGVDWGNAKFLRSIRERYPQDFATLTRVFPDCVSVLERDDIRERHSIKYANRRLQADT